MSLRRAASLAGIAVFSLTLFGPHAKADPRLATELVELAQQTTLVETIGYDGGYRGHWGYPSYPRNYGYSRPHAYRPLPWYGYYLYEYQPYVRHKYRRKHRRQHERGRSYRHHHHQHRH